MPHSYLNSVGLLLPSIVSSALGMAASDVAVRSECSGCVGGKNSSRVCSCGDIGDGIELNPNAVDLEPMVQSLILMLLYEEVDDCDIADG